MGEGSDRGELKHQEVVDAMHRQSDMIYRICRLNLRSPADAEDVFQEVFVRLLRHDGRFENEEHQKAWLCRVAINLCKDWKRSFWHRNVSFLQENEKELEIMDADSVEKKDLDLWEAVRALPVNLRNVVHLHYFEGYSIPEVAVMLNRKPNTLYSDMNRARKRLRAVMRGNNNDG